MSLSLYTLSELISYIKFTLQLLHFQVFDRQLARDRTPFFSPARIIPWDNSPRSLTGFKLATTITFRPIKSSGL